MGIEKEGRGQTTNHQVKWHLCSFVEKRIRRKVRETSRAPQITCWIIYIRFVLTLSVCPHQAGHLLWYYILTSHLLCWVTVEERIFMSLLTWSEHAPFPEWPVILFFFFFIFYFLFFSCFSCSLCFVAGKVTIIFEWFTIQFMHLTWKELHLNCRHTHLPPVKTEKPPVSRTIMIR